MPITALPFTDAENVSQAVTHAMEMASPCGWGSRTVWYSFVAAADGVLVADTAGSDYDTILDVWRGELTADVQDPGFEELELLACSDNTAGSLQAGVVFNAVAGQAYVLRVSAAFGDPGGNLQFGLHPR